MNYRLKLLLSHYEQMQACLLSNTAVEQGCFLLCSTTVTPNNTIIIVNEVISLTENDLLIQKDDLLSVTPEAMLRITRLAQQNKSSICMVHTHPMVDGPVDFSYADDLGNSRSFKFFNRMLPDATNSCLVWDGNMKHVAGRIYPSQKSSNWAVIEDVEITGYPTMIKSTPNGKLPLSTQHQDKFDRQVSILGKAGQESLAQKHVIITGAGGIGSNIAVLLAHAGIGKLTIIDYDIIDETNLPRVIGATMEDVLNKVPKVDIIKRYISNVAPDCEVVTYQTPVEDPGLQPLLTEADAIICATDSTRSRALLNQLCQQYYIPLLDLGVQFKANTESGKLINEIGKVNLVLPGTPCLVCTGHIDPERLRIEGLSDHQREILEQDGYIQGIDEPEPSMMPYNMEVAARGTQILIAQLTGLRSIDSNLYERFAFLGLAGRPHFKHVRKAADPECIFCSPYSAYLGTGDPWVPLIQPLQCNEERNVI